MCSTREDLIDLKLYFGRLAAKEIRIRDAKLFVRDSTADQTIHRAGRDSLPIEDLSSTPITINGVVNQLHEGVGRDS